MNEFLIQGAFRTNLEGANASWRIPPKGQSRTTLTHGIVKHIVHHPLLDDCTKPGGALLILGRHGWQSIMKARGVETPESGMT
jgi:hypothetical protein